MVLFYSDKLDGDLKASWIDVTEEVIQKETALYVGVLPSVVKVNVVITKQTLLASSRSRMLNTNRYMHAMSIGALRRNLQSSLPSLEIEFDSFIQFPSEEENWSSFRMVAGGFRPSREQARYILDLKSGNTTDFSNLNSMTLEVEGEIVTESIVDPVKDNTLYFIIAGAVGGVLVLVLSLGIIYYRGQNKRIESGSVEFKVQVVEVDKDGGGEYAPTDTDTFQDTYHQSYFGTIQRNDFDDVSTLGDPYMGEVVNPAMNTDITVGER